MIGFYTGGRRRIQRLATIATVVRKPKRGRGRQAGSRGTAPMPARCSHGRCRFFVRTAVKWRRHVVEQLNMDLRKMAFPLLAFAGGAVLGRLLGIKTLVRGAMTAAAVTGMVSQPALVGPAVREVAKGPANRNAARRRTTNRPVRKGVVQKRSKLV
jgi:hypothetical protein